MDSSRRPWWEGFYIKSVLRKACNCRNQAHLRPWPAYRSGSGGRRAFAGVAKVFYVNHSIILITLPSKGMGQKRQNPVHGALAPDRVSAVSLLPYPSRVSSLRAAVARSAFAVLRLALGIHHPFTTVR